jgi:hypothetical protein
VGGCCEAEGVCDYKGKGGNEGSLEHRNMRDSEGESSAKREPRSSRAGKHTGR